MNLQLSLLCCLVLFAGIVGTSYSQGDENVTFDRLEHDGTNFEVRYFTPSTYDAEGDAYPVVIAYHPSGGSGASMARLSRFDEYAEENDVIVVYPSSTYGYWDYGVGLPEWEPITDSIDDFGFSEKLYNHVLENYNVDTERIYLVGFSNGARMAMRMACELPEWYAGVAAVASGMTSEVQNICGDAQLPVFYQHGTDDLTVPFEGKGLSINGMIIGSALPAPEMAEFWAIQNGCDLDPVVTDLEDGNPDDSVTIQKWAYTDCESDFPVVFYILQGGGHSWVNARTNLEVSGYVASGDTSKYIWEFFDLYRDEE